MTTGEPAGWLSLVHQHLAWYPLMELPDVYKLLYQGVLGSEHLVTSGQEFASHLQVEYDQQLPDPTQRLLEVIHPDGALYRLNLRPCKARQLQIGRLLPALLKTPELVRGSKAELLTAWEYFIECCAQGLLRIYEAAPLQSLSHWLIQQDYPVVHHSLIYIREYRPSYRLIAAAFLPDLDFNQDASSQSVE